MNELIKELLLKAGFTNAYTDPKEGFELVFVDEDHTLESVTKFAELIVRECLDQIGDAIPDTNCSAADAYKTAKLAATSRVKEHFGVSE